MATTQFRALRALRLSLVVWARNLVPFTLFALAIYGPLVVLAIALVGQHAPSFVLDPFSPVPYLVTTGISTLAMPLLIYRVIQELGGARTPMRTSAKHGVRGIAAALLIGALSLGLSYLSIGGAVIGLVVLPLLFVTTPAAVAERRGPLAAIARSAQLTGDCWLRIFAMRLIFAFSNGVFAVFRFPMWRYDESSNLPWLHAQAIALLTFAVAFQLFAQILQTVTYVLLREAKEGVPSEELARVFE